MYKIGAGYSVIQHRKMAQNCAAYATWMNSTSTDAALTFNRHPDIQDLRTSAHQSGRED
jgi:hypothetical protein